MESFEGPQGPQWPQGSRAQVGLTGPQWLKWTQVASGSPGATQKVNCVGPYEALGAKSTSSFGCSLGYIQEVQRDYERFSENVRCFR